MDELTRCYKTQMRIRVDPELIVDVEWFWCAPGALRFEGVHAFGSMGWETDDREYPAEGLGEINVPGRPIRSRRPADALGRGTPTPADWFENGVPAGVVGPWPFGPCPPAVDVRQLGLAIGLRAALRRAEPVNPLIAVAWQVRRNTVFQPMNYVLSAMDRDLRPMLAGWHWALFTDEVVNVLSSLGSLHEANFPGYARAPLDWNNVLTLEAFDYVTLRFGPSTFTRDSSAGAPVTVSSFGAIDGAGNLRFVALLPDSYLLAVAGDQAFIGDGYMEYGLCQDAEPPPPLPRSIVAKLGLGLGLTVGYQPSQAIAGQLGFALGLQAVEVRGGAIVPKLGASIGLQATLARAAPAPPPILKDLFIGANGTQLFAHTMDVGPGWNTQSGSVQIQSNRANPRQGTASGPPYNWVETDAGRADATGAVRMLADVGAGDAQLGLVFGCDPDINAFYAAVLRPQDGHVYLYHWQSGLTSVGNAFASIAYGTTYSVSVTAAGGTATIKVNGATVLTVSGLSYTSSATHWGLWAYIDSPFAGYFTDFVVNA
jgi:hypothetical protein